MNEISALRHGCASPVPRKIRGFTLIELLIAMSLTVLTGAISYRFLDASVRMQEQAEAAQQSLIALEQTWQLLAADLQNSIDRPLVTPATGADFLPGTAGANGPGSRRPSMMSATFNALSSGHSLEQLLSRDGALLWFSRQAWVNPLSEQRSEIQRVLYRIDENGNLFRDYWPERNQDISSAPEGSLLLVANVRRLQIGFLPVGQFPDDAAWLTQWPPASGLPAPEQNQTESRPLPVRNMPAAVRVSIETESVAEGAAIERIFIPAGL